MSDQKSILEKFQKSQQSLVVQSADLSLLAISQMAEGDAIDVSPDYQRRERWTQKSESKLIESFLLNIPVPPVYLAEYDYGKFSVIDGKQRLTSIWRFMTGQFKLSGLDKFKEIDGLHFSELPTELQNTLNVRPFVRAVTLLKQSDPDLKYEVFIRLNQEGRPLLAQEIRNAAFRGKFNDLLIKLSESPFLLDQLKISSKKESAYTTMQNIELTLRFFALSEGWKTFSGDLQATLDEYMRANQKKDQTWLDQKEKDFIETLNKCQRIWGEKAFKRPAGAEYRDQLLAGLYDAQMQACFAASEEKIQNFIKTPNSGDALIREAFDIPEFEDAVRVGTNTPTKLRYRINKLLELINR